MPSNNSQNIKTRRRFVRSAAAGLLTVPLLATSTLASDAESSDADDIQLEDGELVYTGPKKSVTPAQASQSSIEVSPSDLNGYMQTGVEGLNDAKSDGYVEFEEREDQLWVTPTEKGLNEYGSNQEIGILCGKNDYEAETTWRGGVRHALYLEDSLSRNVATAMASGATAGAIGGIIASASGIGAPIGVISTIAGLLAGLGALVIYEANDGCGVRIRHYPAAPPVPGVGITFQPQ
ncbi:hypothetical protein [Halostagnicola bangensis]